MLKQRKIIYPGQEEGGKVSPLPMACLDPDEEKKSFNETKHSTYEPQLYKRVVAFLDICFV